MYTAYKRQEKKRTFVKFALVVLPVLLIVITIVWYIFFRDQGTVSTNFAKEGEQVAIVKPQTQDFNTDLYKITLPSSWVDRGKQNPYSNQVYYEYQSNLKNNDNRWLRVYVDIFPTNFAVTRVLPITVNQNKIVNEGPESISDECRTFTGAPLSGNSSMNNQTWSAKWKNVTFTCDMNKALNYVGTASVEEGYGVTLVNSNGAKHKYFFLYIDHNVRPDYNIFTDAMDSFTVK